jgi:hypothetical protein
LLSQAAVLQQHQALWSQLVEMGREMWALNDHRGGLVLCVATLAGLVQVIGSKGWLTFLKLFTAGEVFNFFLYQVQCPLACKTVHSVMCDL